jgi:hypothetical protein
VSGSGERNCSQEDEGLVFILSEEIMLMELMMFEG